MEFQVVDSYYRQEHFDFFRGYQVPFYDITLRFDITATVAWSAAAQGRSLYAEICRRFTAAANAVEDFRYRWRDGRIVRYAQLHPGITVPAPGGRFSFCYLRWEADSERYHSESAVVMRAAEATVTLAGGDHSNYLFFTALPKVPFEHFSHAPSNDPLAAEPKVAIGRFRREGGRTTVPIAIQVNHAFIDGQALGALFERAENAFASDPDQPGGILAAVGEPPETS